MSKSKVDISIISDWSFLILNTTSAICTIGSTIFIISGQSNSGIIKLLYGCIFFIIISCGHYILKLNRKYKDKMFKVSEMFHEINHNIRNEMCKISYYNDKGQLTPPLLENSFTTVVKYAVDSLQEVLTILNGKEVSVCIRYFCDKKENILDSTLKVLKRSSNTSKIRSKNNRLVKALEVTDYINILAGSDYYYNKNILEDKQYMNTHNVTNFYKTKIVVPIRVDILEVDEKSIQGFICADCETAEAFDKNFEICKSLLFGVADDLYGYFKDYRKYSLLINK